MSRIDRGLRLVRPSEWVVVAFLAHCAARLAWIGGSGASGTRWFVFPSGQILLSLLAALAIKTVRRSRSRPSARDLLARSAADLRTWWPVLGLVACYPLVPLVIGPSGAAVWGGDADAWLAAADRALFFGVNPNAWLERVVSPLVSEWMALCYSLYGFVFLAVAAMLFLDERGASESQPAPAARFVLAIALVLAAGYVGYTVLPAIGPMYTMTFRAPIELRYTDALKEAVVDRRRIARDCFPSLHTAVTLVCMAASWRWLRAAFWIALPVTATIPVACVYLRYHYVVDVLAGAALAAGACAVAFGAMDFAAARSPERSGTARPRRSE